MPELCCHPCLKNSVLVPAAEARKPGSQCPQPPGPRGAPLSLALLGRPQAGSVGLMRGWKIPASGLCLIPLETMQAALPSVSPSSLSAPWFTFWTDSRHHVPLHGACPRDSRSLGPEPGPPLAFGPAAPHCLSPAPGASSPAPIPPPARSRVLQVSILSKSQAHSAPSPHKLGSWKIKASPLRNLPIPRDRVRL